MKQKRSIHFLVLALSVFAVVLGQVFGGVVSYICSCEGKVVVTQASHCHPETHEPAVDCSHSEHGSGKCNDHEVVISVIQGTPAASATSPVPRPVCDALPPSLVQLVPPPRVVDWEPGRFFLESPPPLAVTVVRIHVLLI